MTGACTAAFLLAATAIGAWAPATARKSPPPLAPLRLAIDDLGLQIENLAAAVARVRRTGPGSRCVPALGVQERLRELEGTLQWAADATAARARDEVLPRHALLLTERDGYFAVFRGAAFVLWQAAASLSENPLCAPSDPLVELLSTLRRQTDRLLEELAPEPGR